MVRILLLSSLCFELVSIELDSLLGQKQCSRRFSFLKSCNVFIKSSSKLVHFLDPGFVIVNAIMYHCINPCRWFVQIRVHDIIRAMSCEVNACDDEVVLVDSALVVHQLS